MRTKVWYVFVRTIHQLVVEQPIHSSFYAVISSFECWIIHTHTHDLHTYTVYDTPKRRRESHLIDPNLLNDRQIYSEPYSFSSKKLNLLFFFSTLLIRWVAHTLVCDILWLLKSTTVTNSIHTVYYTVCHTHSILNLLLFRTNCSIKPNLVLQSLV